jgi:hypothetical protein
MARFGMRPSWAQPQYLALLGIRIRVWRGGGGGAEEGGGGLRLGWRSAEYSGSLPAYWAGAKRIRA